MVQWLRIRLPVQGTQVQSPVQEDSTRYEQLNPCTATTEPTSLEPMLWNKRSKCNEKPRTPQLESSPCFPQLEKSPRSKEDPARPKINKAHNNGISINVLSHTLGFPDGSAGKESACNAGDPGLAPGSGRSVGERIGLPTPVFLGFPGGSAGKETACNVGDVGDLGSIPGLGRSPGEGKGYPL